MNKKKIIYGMSILVTFVILLIIYSECLIKNKDNNINEITKYRLITDMRQTTMLNDGGSHTNQYYDIDFENMNVVKYEDIYKGFEGYIYKGKKLYEKQLKRSENEKLKKLISKIIEEKSEVLNLEKSDCKYYILLPLNDSSINYNNMEELENIEGSIIYNNYELIKSIENILKN